MSILIEWSIDSSLIPSDNGSIHTAISPSHDVENGSNNLCFTQSLYCFVKVVILHQALSNQPSIWKISLFEIEYVFPWNLNTVSLVHGDGESIRFHPRWNSDISCSSS